MWVHKRIGFCLVLSGAASAALADEPYNSDEDDVIVITGTRIETPLSQTGTSVTVIGAEDIERRQQSFVRDALQAAPGVTVSQTGSFGGAASVRIRGNGSEQTLVLIDGIAVNDPSAPGGGFDFATLDAANIERIEILRGPQSVLWGSDAIGGVVNIVSAPAEEDLTLTGFAEGGAFGTVRAGGSASVSVDGFHMMTGLSAIHTDGISKADENDGNAERDAYDNISAYGRAGYVFSGRARIEAFGRFSDSEVEFDSFGFPTGVVDGDESSTSQEWSAGVRGFLTAFGGRLENEMTLSRSSIDRDNFSGGLPAFSARGERTSARYLGTLAVAPGHVAAFGVEHEEAEADAAGFGITSVFGLYQATVLDTLTLSGGVRFDDHEVFGSEVTSRIAGAWAPADDLILRASWGEGFKAPTVFQLTFFCCGASMPNMNLKPESSQAFDVGAEWHFWSGRGNLQITFFHQETDNLITFAFADGNFRNIAETRNRGVELAGKVRLLESLELRSSYAWIDAVDRATESRLIRLPEHSADLEAVWTPWEPLTVSLAARYAGEQGDVFGTIDSYIVADLRASYEITGGMQVYGRIDNLLNEEYQELFGYGTPDLSAYGGVRARF